MAAVARRSNLVLVQPIAFRPHGDDSGAPNPALQWRIGQGLRSMYEGLGETPLPERLEALIAGLEERLG